MLTVTGASRRLIRLLGSQEFSQHPVITSLAHRQSEFAPVETNDLAAPTALDHGRRSKVRLRHSILKQNCHRNSFGTQASCLLNSSFLHAAGGTPAYPLTPPVSDFFP